MTAIIEEYEAIVHGQKVIVKRYKAQTSTENPYERLAEVVEPAE